MAIFVDSAILKKMLGGGGGGMPFMNVHSLKAARQVAECSTCLVGLGGHNLRAVCWVWKPGSQEATLPATLPCNLWVLVDAKLVGYQGVGFLTL